MITWVPYKGQAALRPTSEHYARANTSETGRTAGIYYANRSIALTQKALDHLRAGEREEEDEADRASHLAMRAAKREVDPEGGA